MGEVPLDIIKEAAAGNKQAFEEIYKQHSRFVYYVALRIVDYQDQAQEVVQEVFLKVYQKLRGFSFEASLKTWIYRITINTALNYRRQHKYEMKEIGLDETMAFAVNEKADAYALEEDQEKVIKKCLACLDDDQRVCLVLRAQEGLSYEEIARVLKVKINTVRSRLKRARLAMMAMRKEVVDHDM